MMLSHSLRVAFLVVLAALPIQIASAQSGLSELLPVEEVTPRYGNAIALTAQFAAIGDRSSPGWPSQQGAVYVFRRIRGTWVEWDKLARSDGVLGTDFGAAVAMTPTRMLVGAPTDFQGAVYVFKRHGDEWYEVDVLRPPDAVPPRVGLFGSAVALSGNVAAIGQPDGTPPFNPGEVHVYEWRGRWRREAILTASDGMPADLLGESLALSGDLLVAGAPGSSCPWCSHAVYVFSRARGSWEEVARLMPPPGSEKSLFGESVAVAGDIIAVGGPAQDEIGGEEAGSVYVFRRSADGWNLEAMLSSADYQDSHRQWFGTAVAVHGDTLVVGARGDDEANPDPDPWDRWSPGAVYIFRRSAQGQWVQERKLMRPDAASRFDAAFGSALAIGGPNLVIGSLHGGAHLLTRPWTTPDPPTRPEKRVRSRLRNPR
jgi:hypothetical protein